MSNTKREPLFSDDMVQTAMNLERMLHMRENCSENEADIWSRGVTAGIMQSRQYYEAARDKDAELIQMAVDEAKDMLDGANEFGWAGTAERITNFLAAAEAAGFKPSDR